MDRVLEILNAIVEVNTISQRKLSKLTGVSLGTVNATIQSLVKDDVLVIEELPTKGVRYHITSKGWDVRAHKSYIEMVNCYQTISNMKARLKDQLDQLQNEGIIHFYIDGNKDEVYRLVKMTLIEVKRELNISYGDYSEIEEGNASENSCILFWDIERSYPKELKVSNIFMN